MGKFAKTCESRTSYRWQLLATVSAIALLGSAINEVQAADTDRPILWIDLGGQFERQSDAQEPFAPHFVSALLENPFMPPAEVQAPPRYSIGEEGRISFNPKGSDWIFSAAIRYGRANGTGNKHQETSPATPRIIRSIPSLGYYRTRKVPLHAKRFATTVASTHDSHLLLDFQAGKDVGLGIFGSQGSSTVSAGVRIAQFASRSSAAIDADPDFTISYKYVTKFFKVPNQSWDLYAGKMNVSRRFTGIGPSLKWDASATLAGNPQVMSINFDWGVNGAVLFGRQKMWAHHQTTDHRKNASFSSTVALLPLVYQTSHNPHRTHSVVVPNVGGFAGLSFRYADAKLSLGYRADFFFNAIDGGIDTRKSENRGFYGPFASVSVGIGD